MRWSLILVLALGLVQCGTRGEQSAKETGQQTSGKEVAVEDVEPLPVNTLGPMDSIKDLDKQIESYHLGDQLTESQKKENKALKRKIIRGTFDIRELCRLALAKHWGTITKDQQDRVVGLMTSLLEKKAVFSKERLTGKDKYYNIRYLKEELDKDDAKKSTVNTQLLVPKRDLKVNIRYKLLQTAWGWKIFDVIVDESSMLLNYRSAFHNIITKEGFDALVSRMQKKLDEIQ